MNPITTPKKPTKKVKNDTKIKSKSKVRIEENLENKRCLTTWVQPEIVFEPNSTTIKPQKVKNSPKTKSNSKVTFEESIENESCATILVDPKNV